MQARSLLSLIGSKTPSGFIPVHNLEFREPLEPLALILHAHLNNRR